MITIDKKQHFLGYFMNETEAAIAYDKASLRLRGETAKVNFDYLSLERKQAKELPGPTNGSKQAKIGEFSATATTASSVLEPSARSFQYPLSPPPLPPPSILPSLKHKVSFCLHLEKVVPTV